MLKNINYELLEKFLSAERVGTYLRLADGDKHKASDLYIKNLEQCQFLYVKLHWLEIGLRNAINRQLSQKYGIEWFDNQHIGFAEKEQSQLKKAREILIKNRKKPTNGNMVAEINFGLWVNLFNNPYENLWRRCLRQAFTPQTGTIERKKLSKSLHCILKFRNRIAHYEPIIYYEPIPEYNLLKMQQDIIDIVCLIEPNIQM